MMHQHPTDSGEGVRARPKPWDQLKLFISEHLNGHWDWRIERSVARAITVPELPRTRPRDELWAVSVVRDEADIVLSTIDQLLRQGVDHVLIADHGSRDGTREMLLRRAQTDSRVHVAIDSSRAHYQKEKISLLSRLASQAGARWVLPFDADEWWFARDQSVKQFLQESEATVIRAATVNAIVTTQGTLGDESELMIEPTASADSKVAFRAHRFVLVGPGNHGVARVGTEQAGLVIVHVPYRSADQLVRKAKTGARALDDAGASESEGWHWRVGARLSAEQAEEMWRSMLAGAAAPEIGWRATDPAVRERVLTWSSWDPRSTLPSTWPRSGRG